MYLIFLFFLSRAEEYDLVRDFPIDEYDEWQDVNISAETFKDKKVLIKGENVKLHIQGGNLQTSIRVESETQLIFELFDGDIPHYLFDFLITNGTVLFDESAKIICKGILRVNYKSFANIAKLPFKTNELQLYSNLPAVGMTILKNNVSVIFLDQYYFTIPTNQFPVSVIIPATCLVVTPDQTLFNEPIQSLPIIQFYGDSTSICGITLFNEWENVLTNWATKFNIITSLEFQFGYESLTPILQDKFNVQCKNAINVTGILGGVYNIVELNYAKYFDIEIPNYAVANEVFAKKFVPVNSHLEINFYGFFKSETPFKFDSLNYPDTHIVLRSMNFTSYLTVGSTNALFLDLENLELRVDQDVKIKQLTVQGDSQMVITKSSKTELDTAEFLGNYIQNEGILSISSTLTTKLINLNTIPKTLIDNKNLALTLKLYEAPDIISWEKSGINIYSDGSSYQMKYTKFNKCEIQILRSTSNYQTRLSEKDLESVDLSNHAFVIDQECESKLSLFYEKQWNDLSVSNFKVKIQTKLPVIIKTEGDYNYRKDLFEIFPTPEIVGDTSGQYCIISSGKEFSHCGDDDERLLSSIKDHNFWVNQAQSSSTIYIVTNADYSFSTSHIQSNTKVMIKGYKNSVNFSFSSSQITALQFYNVSVNLQSSSRISLQNLTFYFIPQCNLELNQNYQISTSLKAKSYILNQLLPLLLPSKTLIIENIFDGNEKSIVLTKSSITLNYNDSSISPSIFDLTTLNRMHFHIGDLITTEDNPLDIIIDIPRNSLISQLFNVYSLDNGEEHYIRFPQFTGNEYYIAQREKGVFQEGRKWEIIVNHPNIPSDLFDFPSDTKFITSMKNTYCVYKSDQKKCPPNSKMIQYPGRMITSNDIQPDGEQLDLYIYGSDKENKFEFDKSVFPSITNIYCAITREEFIILPNDKINYLYIKGLTVEFANKACNVDNLYLVGAYIDADEITSDLIYASFNTIQNHILKKLTKGTTLQIVCDGINIIDFNANSVKLNSLLIDMKVCSQLDIIFFNKFTKTSPLAFNFSDLPGTNLRLIPSFYYNVEDDLYVHFTKSWEAMTTKSDPIYFNCSRFKNTYITSDYREYPSAFYFTNPVFTPSTNVTAFCLVPNEGTTCPTHYDKVIYDGKTEILPSQIKPTPNSQSVYLIIDSTIDNYPIFPSEVLENSNVTFSGTNQNVAFIKVNIQNVNSIELDNVNLIIQPTDSNILPSINNLVLDEDASISVINNQKIKVLNLRTPSDRTTDLVAHLDPSKSCSITIDVIGEPNAIYLDELCIILKNLNENHTFNFQYFSNVTFVCSASRLYIDYIAKSNTTSYSFMPSIVFVDGSPLGNTIVFSNKFHNTKVTTNSIGQIHNDAVTQLYAVSEYHEFPTHLFHLPENCVQKVKKQGYYCLYNSQINNDWNNCDADITTIVPISNIMKTITLGDVEANEGKELHLWSTFNAILSSELLTTKITLYSPSSNQITYTILCENEMQSSSGSITSDSQTKIVFTGSKDIKLASLDLVNVDFQQDGKFQITELISLPISSINILQKYLTGKTKSTYVTHPAKTVIIMDKSVSVDDYSIDKEIFGHIIFFVSNSNYISVSCKDTIINDTCGFRISGDALMNFDNSVYEATTSVKGQITNLNGVLTLKSKVPGKPPPIFTIPDESSTCIYEFGPPRTPLPTRSPVPLPTPTRTLKPTKGPTLNSLGLTPKQTPYAICIIIISFIIVLVSIYLLYKYFYHFQEAAFSAFGYSTSDILTARDIYL